MLEDNGQESVDKTKNKRNEYSTVSLITAVTPLIILLVVYLYCLILSSFNLASEDDGEIWWIFLGTLLRMAGVIFYGNIASVLLGIKGLKTQKTLFAWSGILIVLFEFAFFVLFCM